MKRYIDADKLIAEIEWRKNESRELAQEHKDSSLGIAAETMANEDEEILSLIATLQHEQPESGSSEKPNDLRRQSKINLKKEVKSYIKDNFTITDEAAKIPEEDRVYSMWEDDMVAFAKHFFELGRINARKEE